MSLVGNLEDLGLGEILQIVSLSRKSGVLELNSRDRSGKIVFRAGQVTRATATTFPENIGDLLLRGGLIDFVTLKKAVQIQQGPSGGGRRIGDIVVDEFGVAREEIDKLVREQTERIVYSFFAWNEGDFSFELGEPEELVTTILNPLHFMLDSGLNPQWLAMEGSRLYDEKRHRGDDTEECGESLVNLDDLLGETGDGGGESTGATADAKRNDVAAPDTPSVSSGEAPSTGDKQLFNIGVELYREMGEASGLTLRQIRQSPGLHLLRSMLEELNNPSLGGGIILLILRFASELMNRAVVFLVKDQEVAGLGQFGIELDGKASDAVVRNTRIPTGEASLFSDVLVEMKPIKVIPRDCPWNNYLFNQFGTTRAQEVFLGPLVSEGRIVAVLYGDNLPEQKPIGDTEALEVFLSEAGLAMEKALQERRLTEGRATV
jgi:hypothetical protein